MPIFFSYLQVAGEFLIMTVPSASVRNLTASDLTKAMQFWDQIVEAHQ
jgi:hypothetical protein